MKIRLSGRADTVRAWARVLESSFNAQVKEHQAGNRMVEIIHISDHLAAIFAAPDAPPPLDEAKANPSAVYRGQAGARARWEAYYEQHPDKRKANRAKGANA